VTFSNNLAIVTNAFLSFQRGRAVGSFVTVSSLVQNRRTLSALMSPLFPPFEKGGQGATDLDDAALSVLDKRQTNMRRLGRAQLRSPDHQ
jgi:hypothetical protein